MIKAIIFDFNGTMVNDDELNNGAWNQFMMKYIGRELTSKEFNDYVHGRHADIPINHFIEGLSEEEVLKLVEEKEDIYRNLCQKHPEIFYISDGLIPFLDYCKQQGIKLSIGTAAPLKNLQFFYSFLDLQRWFTFENLVYNDGKIAGKPNPAVYLKAAENLKTNPEECAIFEDALSGIQAGRNGGFKQVIAVGNKLSNEQWKNNGATHCVDNFKNLKDLISIINE